MSTDSNQHPDREADTDTDSGTVTELLLNWNTGDTSARDRLMRYVYRHLHNLASRQLNRERPDHTLQPTALVNEAFLNLDGSNIDWQSRNHFFALAARTMRRILVDHARARNRDKRGGEQIRVEMTTSNLATPAPDADMLALNQALDDLAEHNQRTARVLELTYFGGMTRDAVASVLDISCRTVDRDLKLGRAWLHNRLVRHADDV